MSAVRKNAQRLKRLRRAGVQIDANYRVTGTTVQALGLSPRLSWFENVLLPRQVDVARDLYRLDPCLQRVILSALGEAA